jgi:NACalpha-BTF3-like transcription factor
MKLSRLSQYGVKEEDIKLICQITETKNNQVRLNPEALQEILAERL